MVVFLESECVWIDNQYWSYGRIDLIHDVSDYVQCCLLCKENPQCTRFSYGKEGHGYVNQCHINSGGNPQSRNDFMSSPSDISTCSCFPQGGFIIF